ncbi:MAG: glycosyl transferase [Candidatus Saccharibacteria bacterium]|nr:glycosyl transferase [Candidatus Saccharibacteria bacterium]
MAKIDILLTYWGDLLLLKKAVESVIAQTEPDWRLIVIDDCYPGNVAAKYFDTLKDKRITYFKHKKNIGITHNFNYAIGQASAEFCTLLGCDDKMLPNYIEVALKNIGNAEFYQPGVQIIDDKDHIYLPLADRVKRMLQPKKTGMYGGQKLATSLSHGNWLYFPSIVWKTKTIQQYGFDTRYKIAEDLVLEFNIIIDGGTLSYDTTPTFQYRRFEKSLSSIEKTKGGVRFNEEDEVYNHFAHEFKKIGWTRAARAARLRPTSRLHQLTVK